MSLQQLSHKQRIQFLVEFIGNIVSHSTEDERLKKLIKVERLKRKIIPEPPVNLEPIGKSIIFNNLNENYKKSKPIIEQKQTFHLKRPPKKINYNINQQHSSTPIKTQHTSAPKVTRSSDDLINKINKFVNDKSVQMIECPGPGKNILVKVRNKVNITKLVLTNEEIKNIIIYYSDYARIPIVNGFLRASVDQMMISAIVSKFAGSRFIINKRNPYDLLVTR